MKSVLGRLHVVKTLLRKEVTPGSPKWTSEWILRWRSLQHTLLTDSILSQSVTQNPVLACTLTKYEKKKLCLGTIFSETSRHFEILDISLVHWIYLMKILAIYITFLTVKVKTKSNTCAFTFFSNMYNHINLW